jgi:hypothetical protein
LALQELAKKSFGSVAIATPLNQNVDYIPVLIDRPPQVVALIADSDEHLIQVPGIAQRSPATLQPPNMFGPELQALLSDRLVGHRDATLGEQVFDLAETETETVVEPHRVADDLGRESIAVVAWLSVGHAFSVAGMRQLHNACGSPATSRGHYVVFRILLPVRNFGN